MPDDDDRKLKTFLFQFNYFPKPGLRRNASAEAPDAPDDRDEESSAASAREPRAGRRTDRFRRGSAA